MTTARQALGRLMAKFGPPPQVLPGLDEPEPDQGQLLAEQADEFLAWVWERKVPVKFRGARLEPPAALHGELVEWADGRDPTPNVVLLGPTGTGKSWLAAAAARAWLAARWRPLKAGVRQVPFVYAPVVDLLDDMRPGGDDVMGRHAATCALLWLDDVGAERATEWAAERLYGIVDRRWRDELPTIATTNVPAEQLGDVLGQRVLSRLAGGALALRVLGKDRRAG